MGLWFLGLRVLDGSAGVLMGSWVLEGCFTGFRGLGGFLERRRALGFLSSSP